MSLDIYFLNVGHGDCTVIDFDGIRLSVVDINNSKAFDEDTEKEIRLEAKSFGTQAYLHALTKGDDRYTSSMYEAAYYQKYQRMLSDPVEFLQAKFPGRGIFRFILTHPDMDHMTGLYRLRQEGIKIVNFWDTSHGKVLTSADFESQTKYDERDWDEYQRLRSDPGVTSLYVRRGIQRQYYKDDGIWIMAPCNELEALAESTENWNHLSYVLFIKYWDNWVVLGGDATEESWESIHTEYGSWMQDAKVRILKASHHGRDSGYHQPSVAAMSPENTIISVGKLSETDASSKYRHYSKVYTTRYHGDILARLWLDGEVWLYNGAGDRIN